MHGFLLRIPEPSGVGGWSPSPLGPARVGGMAPARGTGIAARILLGSQGALWIVLAALIVVPRDGSSATAAPVIVALLMVVNAAVFIGASLALPRLGRVPFLLLAIFVGANAVLAVTDQVGVLDVLVLAADVVTLVLLLICRRPFPALRRKS
jgi:hypothetical protein